GLATVIDGLIKERNHLLKGPEIQKLKEKYVWSNDERELLENENKENKERIDSYQIKIDILDAILNNFSKDSNENTSSIIVANFLEVRTKNEFTEWLNDSSKKGISYQEIKA